MTTNRVETMLTEGLARIGQAAFPDRDTAGPLVEGEPLRENLGALTVPSDEDNPNPRDVRGGSPVLIAACLFVAVAVVGALVVDRGSSEREPLVTDQARGAEVQVVPIVDGPIASRQGHVSARIGDEVIIWGGQDAVQSSSTAVTGELHDDGVAYDLRAGTWRTIAASPLSTRVRARSTVFGDEMYVVGGIRPESRGLRDGAVYDPSSDTWRRLPDSPVCPAALAPTTSGVFVIGRCEEGDPVEAALYDPASGRWSSVGVPAGVQGVGLVVGNDGLLVVEDGITRRLFTYSVATGDWTDLSEPPISWSQGQPGIVVTEGGSIIVIARTQPPGEDSDITQLATWHPDGGWSRARPLDAPAPDMFPFPRPIVIVEDRVIWLGGAGMAWQDVDGGGIGTANLIDEPIGMVGTPETVLVAAPAGDIFVWGGTLGTSGGSSDGAIITLP